MFWKRDMPDHLARRCRDLSGNLVEHVQQRVDDENARYEADCLADLAVLVDMEIGLRGESYRQMRQW